MSQLFVYISLSMQQSIHSSHLEMSCLHCLCTFPHQCSSQFIPPHLEMSYLNCLCTFPYQCSSQFISRIWRCHVSTVCVHFPINAAVNSFLSSGDVMSQLSMYISLPMQQSIHSSHLEMSCLNCLCTFPHQCSSQFIPLIWKCHVSISLSAHCCMCFVCDGFVLPLTINPKGHQVKVNVNVKVMQDQTILV